MPERTSDPIEWLKGLAESATRVRLAPGVIGKSTYINIGIVILWAIVLFRLSPSELWLDAALIVCAAGATVWGRRECRHMREFAVANPALALMEGADITEHQRFEAEAKRLMDRGQPIIDPNTPPGPIVAPEGPEDG